MGVMGCLLCMWYGTDSRAVREGFYVCLVCRPQCGRLERAVGN